MNLNLQTACEIPEETQSVACATFPKGNPSMLLRDEEQIKIRYRGKGN